jgi:hypothetical protein
VIQPRVPSLFEAAGALDLAQHVEQDAPPGAPRLWPSVEATIAAPPDRVAPQRIEGAAAAVGDVEPTPFPAATRRDGSSRVRGATDATQLPRPSDRTEHVEREAGPPPATRREREDAGAARHGLPAPPSRPAVVVEQPARGDAPSVRVTIGRIEVRAVTPPTPPPRPAARLRPPRLTLDDYVRRRDERAR